MKALIAEDDATSRALLTAIMKTWGYDLSIAEDGGKAWGLMHRLDAPKLALIDWNMPELDGLEVIRRIRSLETQEPPYIILLTARKEKGDIVLGLEAGANDYLVKPFDHQELKARLNVGRRMVELQSSLVLSMRKLETALADLKTLRGIIPICASCKKIRDDTGFWNQVEEYIRDHSEARFSHGICPDCMKRLYPDVSWEDAEESK
ncbi:MAG: response regulator transcription factor [Deltaproteobacteria bacterium]|nr:response regulator transcription factor [Deltaproteobacteria bacterium]